MSWPAQALGDLVDIKGGGTPSKTVPEYWGGTIPWASVKDFKGGILERTEDYITELAVSGSSTNVIAAGSIIVPTRMALGKVAINAVDMAINQDLKALQIKYESKLLVRYLFRFLESKAQFLEEQGKGATVKGITLDVLKGLEIPLPPLPEQKRIAAILDKADAIRRKRQQAIQLADDFLRAVFLDMFGDPVTNPKGFRKGPITELADIITGNAFKSDEYVSDSEVAVRLCRGTNVLTSYFDWSDTAYWPKDQLDGLERYLLSSGDVILAMDRPWISSGLKVCIFPDQEVDTYLVQRVARLRPKEAMFSEYIYSCIKSQAFEKHCCPTETTVPHISPVELRGYEVLIPDKTTLDNYHATVGKIKSAIAGMQDAASYAGNAFESLSQKAFSGQL